MLEVPTDVEEPLLLHGDCLALMQQLPAGCIDLIVTDPPYFKVKGEAWDRQWAKPEGFLAWLGEIADEWRRILAPNGSLYCFASPQMAARVECLIAERFSVLNHVVWAKPLWGHSHTPGRTCKEALRAYFPWTERIIFAEQQDSDSMAMGEAGYEAQCERLRGFVFEPLRAYLADEWVRAGLTPKDLNECTRSQMARHYLTRTQWALPTVAKYAQMQARANQTSDGHLRREYEGLRREYEDLRRPFNVSAAVPYTDVWDFPTVRRYPGKHPCEKPRAMMDHIIAASSRPGAVVLDCFMGSGVAGEAAIAAGRRFIGMEKGDYIHQARERVQAAIASASTEAAAE